MHKATFAAVTLFAAADAASAGLVRPDTAVASSAFNTSSYAAANTINGSGLPADFTAADAHDPYSAAGGGNHWTTSSSDSDRFITWSFDTPVDLAAMVVWNHQSNGGLASNGGYDVTLFDLTVVGDTTLTLTDVSLEPDTATGQTVDFGGLVTGVTSVTFDIEETQLPTTPFTGLAEVAFAVPEPGTAAAALVLCGPLLTRRR